MAVVVAKPAWLLRKESVNAGCVNEASVNKVSTPELPNSGQAARELPVGVLCDSAPRQCEDASGSNSDRHRPGYMAAYMREYRKRKKA